MNLPLLYCALSFSVSITGIIAFIDGYDCSIFLDQLKLLTLCYCENKQRKGSEVMKWKFRETQRIVLSEEWEPKCSPKYSSSKCS